MLALALSMLRVGWTWSDDLQALEGRPIRALCLASHG